MTVDKLAYQLVAGLGTVVTENTGTSGATVPLLNGANVHSGVNNFATQILVDEIAAPGTPATGKVAVYAKADGKLYIKDDAGTETDLTAGAGGTSTEVLLGTFTASTDSSIDIESLISSTYDDYRLEMSGVEMSDDDARLLMRVSTNNGTSYISTTTYKISVKSNESAGVSDDTNSSNTATAMNLTSATATWMIGNAAEESFSGHLNMFDLNNTTRTKQFFCQEVHNNPTGDTVFGRHSCAIDTSAAVDAIQILPFPFTGTIDAGEFRLYGIKKS